MVYHTLLVAYLEYAKRRGFVAAHIWACPPLRAGSYIFPSRPAEQQVPTVQRLRAWYQAMLVVARDQVQPSTQAPQHASRGPMWQHRVVAWEHTGRAKLAFGA